MKNKSYSPVYVHDPTSLQHLVRLHPGQHFVLSLDSKIYPKPDVEVAGDYLKVGFFEHKDDRIFYHIFPKEDFSDWSAYSACFLGEVWVGWKENVAKLIVNLECSNAEKMDHVTIINPDCFDVRIRPYNILEFVVYDDKFDWQDEWTWTWKPEVPFLEMNQLGHDHLSLYPNTHLQQYSETDSPNSRYARYPRTEPEKFFRQHHFWFRFGNSVLKLLDQDGSVERVGNLELHGTPNKFNKHLSVEGRQYTASLHLDLKKRYRAKVLSSLGLKKREEGSHNRSGGSVVYSNVYVPKKPALPVVKDVAINKVSSSWEDCKSIPAKPQPPQQQPYHYQHSHNPYCHHPYLDDEDFSTGHQTAASIHQKNRRVLQYHRKRRGPD